METPILETQYKLQLLSFKSGTVCSEKEAFVLFAMRTVIKMGPSPVPIAFADVKNLQLVVQ